MKRRTPSRGRAVKKGKRENSGVFTQSLSSQAAAIAGGTQPSNYVSGAPATGARPDPGPLPIVDAPTDGKDRFDYPPLRNQVQYGWNAYWTPRRNALTPFATLRALADTCDHVRLCIETRKDQLCSLDYDIAPRDKRAKKDSLSGKIDAARAFFRKPDKKRSFSTWLRMAIEDVLVIDALSVYRRKTYGEELYALEIKDGSTILPLIDGATGDTPNPPDVAYRQIIYGRPVEGGDCTIDDLYYLPRTVRAQTPYGLSPTEAVLLSINAIINRQIFNLAYYTDGNIPEGLLEAPAGFTTKQLGEFQEYLDIYLSGDLERRRKLKVVHPGGSKVFQFKTPDFSGVYDEFLLKLVCAAFAVPPSEVGFTADVNKATSQGQENIVYRRGVKPMGRFFKDLFDDVLTLDLGMPDLQFIWSGGEVEDNLKAAQAAAIWINTGIKSADDFRVDNGDEPIGLGPIVMTPTGPMLVEVFLKQAKEALEAPAPDPNAPKPPAPGQPPKPGAKPGEPAPAADPKGPPSNGAKAPAEPEKIAKDLRTWRAVAIKDAKAGKPPRLFESESIPLELHALVERFLRVAGHDVAKIVAAFDMAVVQFDAIVKAGESRTLTRVEQKTAKAYRKLMAAHFKAEGAALLDHLRKGLA